MAFAVVGCSTADLQMAFAVVGCSAADLQMAFAVVGCTVADLQATFAGVGPAVDAGEGAASAAAAAAAGWELDHGAAPLASLVADDTDPLGLNFQSWHLRLLGFLVSCQQCLEYQ